MPFLPLFIVIGIFLAASKILQPNQQHMQTAPEEFDEKLLNQALIDYIARESRGRSDGGKAGSRSGKSHKKAKQRR